MTARPGLSGDERERFKGNQTDMLQSHPFLLALFAKALCKTLFDLCLISKLHLQCSMAASFSLKKTAVQREIHDDKV